MKLITRILLVLIITSSLLSSCMTTKTNVGTFREDEGKIYTYAKGKQVWLFWGFLPTGRSSIKTPEHGNCKVITRLNFADLLISSLTAGIVTTQTIKIQARKI